MKTTKANTLDKQPFKRLSYNFWTEDEYKDAEEGRAISRASTMTGYIRQAITFYTNKLRKDAERARKQAERE